MHHAIVKAVAAILTGMVASGCAGSSPQPASPTPHGNAAPSLRLVNSGSLSLSGLVVIFPDERVQFGEVAAGTTTTYRSFSRGVYRYAAYQARLGDRIVTQPVIDWVGEEPMRGEAFTYTIEASEGPPFGVHIRLVSATRDR
jgi:hypothetical protein